MHRMKEWQIYSKIVRIKRVKIGRKMRKITCKIKTAQNKYVWTLDNTFVLIFINLLFSYNIKIKVDEYVKLKFPKMNL